MYRPPGCNKTREDAGVAGPDDVLRVEEIIDGVDEGSRDDTLWRFACKLRGEGMAQMYAEAIVRDMARKCRPPFVEEEAVENVRRAYREYKPAARLGEDRNGHKPGAADEAAAATPAGGQHLADLGNARRLVARHGADLRYCHSWSKWLVWDGRRWAEDATGEVIRRAKETVASIGHEAAKAKDDDDRKSLLKHALKSEDAKRIAAMIKLAESEPGIPVTPTGSIPTRGR